MANNTPQAPQTQQVDVEFKASGLGKLKTQWADFAGSLLAPVAVLAAGGTKAQAAWAGMKDVLLTKILGPIGLVTGAAFGFLMVTKKLISEWRTMGVQSAKAVETLTLQFKPLLGSMELAKKRAREVFAFSVKSPFKFAELAEGNKLLEGLTRGALSGKKGMELVGDASAVAGSGFEETARSVGRLYDGIMSGRPVGEAGMRLQELGLISGQTRNQIEAMTAANASGSAIWAVVEKDLQRTKGAMKDLSDSMEGLESTYEDTRTQLEAGFGAGFLEGEKAGIKSATTVLEAMTPVATKLGEVLGNLDNGWEKTKAGVTESITGMRGFSAVVGVAVTALVGLASWITLASGALLGKFVMGVLSAAQASKQLAAAAGSVTAAQTIQTAVTGSLTAAKAALVAMITAVRAGSYAQAAAHLQVAAAQTVAAIRTNALAASQAILSGALKLVMIGVRLTVASLWQMSAALALTPIGAFSALLIAAGTAMAIFYNNAKKTREELQALAAAARATVSNLRQQVTAIRTVADLRKAEGDVVVKLTEAYQQLAEAQAAGNGKAVDIAKKQITQLLAVQAEARGKSGNTRLTDEEVSREDAAKARGKEAALAQGDDRAGRGEQSALEVARERAAKGDALRVAAERAQAEEERVKAAQEASRRRVEDVSAEEGALQGQKTTLIKKKTGATGDEAAQLQAELNLVNEKLKAIREIKDLEAAKVSQVALGSDSELAVLNEKLRIYNELESAKIDAEKANTASREAWSQSDKAFNDSMTGDVPADLVQKRNDAHKAEMAAIERKRAAEKAAESAGVGGLSPEQGQQMERRVQEIKDTRAEDLDPVKRLEEQQAVRDAELGLAQARIDAESQVASLRLKGYEREKAMLDFERQKLAAKQKAGVIDATALAAQKELLAAQEAAMEKAAAEKRQDLQAAYQLAGLSRKEDAARDRGDQAAADALRKQQDAIKDEQTRRDAVKEAQENGYEPGDYAAQKVAEAQAARAQERAKQERERQLGRDGAVADQGSASAAIRARAAEMQGQAKAAKKIREDAAQAQDEIDRREKQRDYREQGFSGAKADQMADQDVKNQQAERLMQELTGRKGFVVADSLAKVGGGGNVTGSDPATRLQERMVKLLEEVADNTKDNVDTMR